MKYFLLIIVLPFSFLLSAQVERQARLFPLKDVQLLESPFLQAQQTDLKYILALEADKLLAPYLREAGLTPKAESYTNWENTGLDGHIGGHYLSALSLMYAATANTEIKQRLDYMISELKRCQDAVGTGFIGGTPGSIPMWQEIKQGNIRAGGFDLNGKWVPLYNIHKIYAGLRDAYLYTDNTIARDMLVKLTDWMIDITGGLSETQMQDMLRSEHGGLNEVFADVAEITGNNKYLELARRFSHQAILNPLLSKEDKLTGLHANTQIPKVIGYKRIADIEKNRVWNDATCFFWEIVTNKRSVSIGGNSVREHFHPAEDYSSMVKDVQGPETCNTYNMLRLSNMLFQTTTEERFIDFYERALYNHILSSQEPEKGGFVYFTPMRPGHYRVYSQPQTSFWCCVGSGLENHTKYGELIYAHNDKDLYVNLFIPSRLNWKEKGITLVQQTRFPDEEYVNLRFEESKKKAVNLKLRYPVWVGEGKLSISINGKDHSVSASPGEYISIERKWKKGDEIIIKLPMQLKIEQLPDKANYYSFKYGPIVLASKTGSEDMDGLYADDSRGGHIAHGRQIPLQETPVLVNKPDLLLSNLRKDEKKPLHFAYTGQIYPERFQSLELIPFFRLHNSRYAVYFQQATSEELEIIKKEIIRKEQLAEKLAKSTVDLIYPGEQQPESDHFIQYEQSTTGTRDNRHYRSATGWFSYEVKVKENNSSLMLVQHKKDPKGENTIYINDLEITSNPVVEELDNDFIRLTYPLPESVSEGVYRLKFTPANATNTARIYEIRITK